VAEMGRWGDGEMGDGRWEMGTIHYCRTLFFILFQKFNAFGVPASLFRLPVAA